MASKWDYHVAPLACIIYAPGLSVYKRFCSSWIMGVSSDSHHCPTVTLAESAVRALKG